MKWHSCAKGVFRSCENFRGGLGLGCVMVSQGMTFFVVKPQFHRGGLGL